MKNKILVLSASDTHGAYEAMHRIAVILNAAGHEVKMVVRHQHKNDPFITAYDPLKGNAPHNQFISLIKRAIAKAGRLINRKKLHFATVQEYFFLGTKEVGNQINIQDFIETIDFNPEFIFVGMVNDFMNTTDIKDLAIAYQAKVFNVAVDMFHFTGGCHYAWECEGYKSDCKNCPAIVEPEFKNRAHENLMQKIENAKAASFNILNMSDWTKRQAAESVIYKQAPVYKNINSIIDTNIFNAQNRNIAKQIFHLDQDDIHILAGSYQSNDLRKGFSYLVDALKQLHALLPHEYQSKIKILIVSQNIVPAIEAIPFEKKYIDYIKDYRLLSLLYQSADVFVNTSVEDSGPMMVSEALACGTPVVGFDMGIVHNMVISQFNGYKARLRDATDLAKGISEIVLLDQGSKREYTQNAVAQVKNHSSYEYVANVLNEVLQHG